MSTTLDATALPAASGERLRRNPSEDWIAVAIGLGLTIAALLLHRAGVSLAWISILPPPWHDTAQIGAHFAQKWPQYLGQFVFWSAVVGLVLPRFGFRTGAVLAGFALVYGLSLAVIVLGQSAFSVHYNLEPPLVALLLGLILANTGAVPASLSGAFRVEFYIKLGIILLGATLPFTLLVWGGPVAIAQASIVSVATFLIIFAAARVFGLDRRFAAVLGAGGAICGVSAAIAIAGAVGAQRREASATIAIVIVWAIAALFFLPFAADALGLSAGAGGAWIGTSEFADAAGIAAAQSFGGIAAHAGRGTADQAVASYTLIKVVGRDSWIGIWAVILSLLATTRWAEPGTGAGAVRNRASASEVWTRFPKFVLGFVVASALLSAVAVAVGPAVFKADITPGVVAPLKGLRIWAFAFAFLSIGLTTRFSELGAIGWRPFAAFSVGAVANLLIGLALSTALFGAYWTAIGH